MQIDSALELEAIDWPINKPSSSERTSPPKSSLEKSKEALFRALLLRAFDAKEALFRSNRYNDSCGNQRERDRERAMARKQGAKGKDDGLTPEQRRERDKKALEEKAAKKAAQAAGAASQDNKSNKGTATNKK